MGPCDVRTWAMWASICNVLHVLHVCMHVWYVICKFQQDSYLLQLRRPNVGGKCGCLGEVVRSGGVLVVELCVYIVHIQGRPHIATLLSPTNMSTLRGHVNNNNSIKENIPTCTHMHAPTSTCTHLHVHLHVHTYVYAYNYSMYCTNMYTHLHAHLHVHTYMYLLATCTYLQNYRNMSTTHTLLTFISRYSRLPTWENTR